MKLSTLLTLSVALVAPVAFAQAQNFAGFSLGGNLEFAQTKVETATTSNTGSGSGLSVQGQYSFAVAPQVVLGVGGSMGLGNRKLGTFGAVDLNAKNAYALDFTGGWAMNNMLFYGKISSLSLTVTCDTCTTDETYTGVGYGLGLRSMIDKNMYWQTGYDWNTYTEKTGVKPSSGVFGLGLGYKF